MEGREYKIWGPGVEGESEQETKESKEQVRDFIDLWRKKAEEPLPDEIEKTPDEEKFIRNINSYIGDEFAVLGLPAAEIVPAQMHLLKEEQWGKYVGKENKKALGICGEYGTIAINIDSCLKAGGRALLFKVFTHEAVHAVSMEKYYVSKEKKISEFGSGYMGYLLLLPKEERHEHFRGLNEMTTEMMAHEIWHEHREAIKKEFDIDFREEEKKELFDYPLMHGMDILLRRMSEKLGEPSNKIWRRFKYGMLSGKMMHLRSVEKAFGRGALRVLAAYQSCTVEDEEDSWHDYVAGRISRYFMTDNEADRENIAKEILVEREYEAYKKERRMPERMEKYKN